MFSRSTRRTLEPPRGATRVDITVVHAAACHYCDDAERALEVLAQRFAMRVRVVDLESAEGLRLTAAHRPAMSPLVLVDGRFFSAGRLPRKKLAALLERTAVEHPTVEPALPSDVPGVVG